MVEGETENYGADGAAIAPKTILKVMTLLLTERIILKTSNKQISKQRLSYLCHVAKNLYNEANYIIRQKFLNEKKWVRYNEIYKIIKNSENYKILPAQTAQQILRILDNNWKAFFKSMKIWKKSPKKFLSRPKIPAYKRKDGEFILVFTSQQIRLKENYLYFPKKTKLKPIKTRISEKIHQVRIIPNGIVYILEIIYEKREIDLRISKENVLGMDLGLNNLITIADTVSPDTYIIKGGVVKSINQFYNKLLAKYNSKRKYGFMTKIRKMTLKRDDKINDFFHKVSRKIINYCILKNIGTIIIGYNKKWKNGIKLGKVNNQNFVQVPFWKLINMIRYKGKLVGIKVIQVYESYTSKCSFLDNEPVKKHKKYMGRRISRGLFKASNGRIINADVNAAFNIIRKIVPEFTVEKVDVKKITPRSIIIK